MSIHEVEYDSKGHVIAARCVDEEIDLHRKNPQPDAPSVHTFYRSPVLDEITPTESGYAGLPAKFHTLTAVNKSTVIESFSELQFARSVRLAPSIIHRREDIADAKVNISGHEYGFVWTEPGQSVDVYVAPALPTPASVVRGFGARLRAAVGR
jgi:uncharacterized protein (DUF736 family)